MAGVLRIAGVMATPSSLFTSIPLKTNLPHFHSPKFLFFRTLSVSASSSFVTPIETGLQTPTSLETSKVDLQPYLSCCMPHQRFRVAVLLSGGVDSSVALRLLHAAGHSCTAFYLKIWFQVCPFLFFLSYDTLDYIGRLAGGRF